VKADLFAQKVDLVLKVFELETSFLVSAGARLQLRYLLLDYLQLPLCFYGWIHD
jgi:hypothetical protein